MKILNNNDPFVNELIEKMHLGDDRCPIKIGDTVEKINSELGDQTPLGTIGVVTGNYYGGAAGNAYLVEFDNSFAESFILGSKIGKI